MPVSKVRIDGNDTDIALAAAISYGRKYVDAPRVEPIIRGLLANKELTPFEFVGIWFCIRCSRACHSQFLQYRHASRITRSTRRAQPIELEEPTIVRNMALGAEKTHLESALKAYEFMVTSLGTPKEKARMILPLSTLTEFYWYANLRELMHFFEERTSERAEEEIRELAKAMREIAAREFPIVFRCIDGGEQNRTDPEFVK